MKYFIKYCTDKYCLKFERHTEWQLHHISCSKLGGLWEQKCVWLVLYWARISIEAPAFRT